jgi:DNA polymerase IV
MVRLLLMVTETSPNTNRARSARKPTPKDLTACALATRPIVRSQVVLICPIDQFGGPSGWMETTATILHADLDAFVLTIGQLAKMPGCSLERIVGRTAREKLMALGSNRDPREIKDASSSTIRRRAQSALGKKPAEEQVFRPALRHLADRVASRLRAKSRPGRTVTVRVRFADLHSVTRSITLDAPISATAALAEIAEDLVRSALADRPQQKTISLAISVSHLEKHWKQQLELSLGLPDEKRRSGTKKGMAWWTPDRAIEVIRDRFGWDVVGYAPVMLGASRSVPDEFRELAEKDL